jgi:protoporphyrinogen oxidase
LRGALQDEAALSGFNNDFWYPIDGGIESLPAALARRVADLRLNQTLTHIDPVARTVQMNGEDTYQYESLVYTLPLIHLPRFLDEIPDHVMQAIDGLQHNVIECVNIGIDRPDISPYHWVYFYEDEFITHRISFPRNFSESTCPPGTSSVCCEVASSKHKPLRVQGKDNIIKATIESLKKANILRDDDTILTAQCLTIDPAYVIYDLDYEKNVKVIHDFLLGLGIHPCGRFGDWQYYNMDHSILSGKRVADAILSKSI